MTASGGYERECIRNMAAYSWGEQPDDGHTIKLNTNENPFPPSPMVAAALKEFPVSELRTYPPPLADRLRDRLADLHGVDRDNVLITHGGDEGLRLAMTTFVEAGRAFGMAEPSYSLYPVLAEIQGATQVKVPLDEHWDLPRDFAHQLNEAGAGLACVVNPHAPSGRLADADRISQIANDFNGVLLVDEAYVDFVDPSQRYDSIRLINAFDNLMLLRTFSKGYSLAGLRLGYLLASESLLAPLFKTRDSYNVDAMSQLLGEAAVNDHAYAEETWRQVRALRRTLRDELIGLGFDVRASQANFLLAEVPMDFAVTARELYEGLKARGILVRYFDAPPLEDKLRISIGTEAQNESLITALGALVS